MSLQEACRLLNSKFISNCERRQELVKQRVRQNFEYREDKQSKEEQSVYMNSVCVREPSFVNIEPKMRPRMTYKEMYEQSKRYWRELPEVKKKAEEERRKREAATNRLRMKIYQKEVLIRMRRLRAQKHK